MSFAAPLKRRTRHLVDRVVQPYVDQISARSAAEAAAGLPDPPPHTDPVAAGEEAALGSSVSDLFHGALHELRTFELERVPKGAKRALSVGANGSWYFEWFRQAVGELDEHIGIEAFEPMPDDLPAYVRWIVNTADQMVDVTDGSVDIVFAGQTTEHLWAGELAGFLLEANRVLRPGGTLVLDSPNRLVTEHLHWSHGGHTVELDAHEMASLLDLAGFSVDATLGLWHCKTANRIRPLEESIELGHVFARRCVAGRERPDESFVWWINATKVGAPTPERLTATVEGLFEEHWRTRVSRGFFPGAHESLHVEEGEQRVLASTLPFALPPGQWELTLNLIDGSWDDVDDVSVSIDLPGSEVVHHLGARSARRGATSVTWRFDQPQLLFAVSIVLRGAVRTAVTIANPIDIRPAPDESTR